MTRYTKDKYRSKFETKVITKLKRRRVKFIYEKERLYFIQPAIERSYLPDLYFPQTNIYVELKGLFMLHPHLYTELKMKRMFTRV